MLPEDHEAKLSRNFSASPEQVFENIAGFANHPKWRSGVTSVSYDPAAKSVVEKNSMGTLPYKILKMDAPRILVTEIDGGKELGFGGTWFFHTRALQGRHRPFDHRTRPSLRSVLPRHVQTILPIRSDSQNLSRRPCKSTRLIRAVVDLDLADVERCEQQHRRRYAE